MNTSFNNTRGNSSNDAIPRVDGNFTGTTDEILQWAACKWGIDEDIVRAQAVIESWWDMRNEGDITTDESRCHPMVRTGSKCPESMGLMQIRYPYHGEAYENGNAILSTAYNVDFTYGKWRECFEGKIDWLNDVERGKNYTAGDAKGCLGVWYAGRWYTQPAKDYIARVEQYRSDRTWESYEFLHYP